MVGRWGWVVYFYIPKAKTFRFRIDELKIEQTHPDIDAIAAALFLTLGITPAYGTALFLCARMAAMVAHIEEARQEPPFSARRAERRSSLAR